MPDPFPAKVWSGSRVFPCRALINFFICTYFDRLSGPCPQLMPMVFIAAW